MEGGGVGTGMGEGVERGIVAGQEAGESAVAIVGDLEEGPGLAGELDLLVINEVEAGGVGADAGAEVPGGEGVLVGGVTAKNHDRFGRW